MNRKLLITLVLSVLVVFSTRSQDIPAAQSLYIFNFTRMIAWPDKTGDFVIGVLGNSAVAGELESVCAGKTVGLQKIIIKRFKDVESIEKCNIVFVSYGKSSAIPDVVNKVNGLNTLIIGEKSGAIDQGAAINFVISERLEFQLKTAYTAKAGLKLSSKLESMAKLVP